MEILYFKCTRRMSQQSSPIKSLFYNKVVMAPVSSPLSGFLTFGVQLQSPLQSNKVGRAAVMMSVVLRAGEGSMVPPTR